MPVAEGYEVFTLQSEPEVQALSQQLWSRHVGHHWRHVDNGITLYVLQPHHVKVALALREAIDTGVTLPPPAPRFNAPMLLNVLARAPVTLLTLVTSTVIFLAIHLGGLLGALSRTELLPCHCERERSHLFAKEWRVVPRDCPSFASFQLDAPYFQ